MLSLSRWKIAEANRSCGAVSEVASLDTASHMGSSLHPIFSVYDQPAANGLGKATVEGPSRGLGAAIDMRNVDIAPCSGFNLPQDWPFVE